MKGKMNLRPKLDGQYVISLNTEKIRTSYLYIKCVGTTFYPEDTHFSKPAAHYSNLS